MSGDSIDRAVSLAMSMSDGSSSTQLDAFDGMNALLNLGIDACSFSLMDHPRIITASELLDECDDDSVFCGPPSEPEESGFAELRALKSFGVKVPEPWRSGSPVQIDCTSPSKHSQRRLASCSAQSDGEEIKEQNNSRRSLIAPRGDIVADNQKFVGVFEIGLEDDPEFCLVKRILGKSGCNMRRVAEECNAKVRLRGIGSGFLEGSSHMEANMPLQLNVSCEDYDSYKGGVTRVAILLKDLYKHYRRYARSRNMEVPDTKVDFKELRRDDLGMDLIAEKAQRSPSERERDRALRRQEREFYALQRQERELKLALRSEGVEEGKCSLRSSATAQQSPKDVGKDTLMMPDGMLLPTTPTGRALAAKTGGAEAAAMASAAAREFERQERERLRKERAKQRELKRQERLRKKAESATRALNLAKRNSQWSSQASSKRVLTQQSHRTDDDEGKLAKAVQTLTNEHDEWPKQWKPCTQPTDYVQRDESSMVAQSKPTCKLTVFSKAPPPLPPINSPSALNAIQGEASLSTMSPSPANSSSSSNLTTQDELSSFPPSPPNSAFVAAEVNQDETGATSQPLETSTFTSSEAAQEEGGDWQVVDRRKKKVLWLI